MKYGLLAAMLVLLGTGTARGQNAVEKQADVVYAVHDGVRLNGDVYRPKAGGTHPAILFIHGGGFRGGSKAGYGATWGPYLAERGYVVFAIDYRLATATQTTWPQALLDCKAALQYLRGNAAALGVDPTRIGVGGDSAGAALAALIGVTQDWPRFANRYPQDVYTGTSTKVKVVIPIYGVYDMMAWEKYTAANSKDKPPLDLYFGGPPEQLPGAYLEASPLSFARAASKNLGAVATANAATQTGWFLSWGTVDAVVPPDGQSIPFASALRDAGANVTALPVPGVDHFWFTASALTGEKGAPSCQEETPAKFVCSGATPNDFIAPGLLEFLERNL